MRYTQDRARLDLDRDQHRSRRVDCSVRTVAVRGVMIRLALALSECQCQATFGQWCADTAIRQRQTCVLNMWARQLRVEVDQLVGIAVALIKRR